MGLPESYLDLLRTQYDFVILDSSPILPVADTRMVSQHVDSVLLSVFRDVSQGARVQAAYEILEAFGARSIEAVMTGEHEHGYGKPMDYAPIDRDAPSLAETSEADPEIL